MMFSFDKMRSVNDRYRIPPPKRLREVPRWLHRLVGAFTSRLLYIFRLVWETRKSLLLMMVFMCVFNGVMPVAISLIGAAALNDLAEVYAGAELAFRAVATLLICQFACMFLTDAVRRVYTMFISVSGELVSNHVKQKIMEKAKTIDMMCYDSPDFYARMENANREAGKRPVQIMSSAFSVLSTAISIVSFTAVLFTVSAWIPVCIIVTAIPSAVINFIYRRKNVDYMSRRSKSRRQMDYYSNTLVNKDLAKEIRIFSLAETFREKYQATFDDYFKGMRRLQTEECLWTVGAAVATNAVYCLLYLFFARGVFGGQYDVGGFSLFTGAITSIGTGVSTLISTTASIYEGTLFINNLMEFLSQKPILKPIADPPAAVRRHQGHVIVFEDVSFRYPGAKEDTLRHIDLTIHEGETVAVVGFNGAGKTTLIKLLTRLYDPTEGRILLDGHDIREYDVDELYSIFGIIFQDFGKYAVSAGENIAFGDVLRSARDGEIRHAARESGADDFISGLPHGYDTPLMRYFEEYGTELSIGQWQKLSIARAFYRDSDILILDEPTASLDPMAEQRIFEEFNAMRRDKTSIFISHRLSSATLADNIFVMERGQIVERGSHRELMEKKGLYYELFTTQSRRYVTTDGDKSSAAGK